MENNFNVEMDGKLKSDIEKLMSLIAKIRENGEFQIFSALFQTDFQILAYLEKHVDAHPSDMADSLNVTRPNIAANLRNLENKGYIERAIDKDNRRQIHVTLTEKGKQYMSLCTLQLSFLFASWFKVIGEEEKAHLFKILEMSSSPELMTDQLKNFTFGV